MKQRKNAQIYAYVRMHAISYKSIAGIPTRRETVQAKIIHRNNAVFILFLVDLPPLQVLANIFLKGKTSSNKNKRRKEHKCSVKHCYKSNNLMPSRVSLLEMMRLIASRHLAAVLALVGKNTYAASDRETLKRYSDSSKRWCAALTNYSTQKSQEYWGTSQ